MIEKDKIINNFPKYMLDKNSDFLIILFTNKEVCKLIIDNNLFWKYFADTVNLFREDRTFEIFKVLYNNDSENKFINEEMYTLFDNNYYSTELYRKIFSFLESRQALDENLIKNILVNKCKFINFNCLKYLLNSEYKNIVINNFEGILNNSYDLLKIKELIKENEILLNKYINYINENPNNLIYEVLSKGFILSLNEIEEEKIFNTIKIIIDELLEYEKLNYSDIEFLGDGALNYVASIGNKVLKIGQKREIFKMDNNRRFLKPILRTQIDSLYNGEIFGCIEITEKVNTENITESDIYILYKELRDKGYYWVDCRKCNAGRLIRKNKVYFNDLEPFKEAINYNQELKEELDAGELVILDNDYIYMEDQFEQKSKETQSLYYEQIGEFENRYQEEKRKGL